MEHFPIGRGDIETIAVGYPGRLDVGVGVEPVAAVFKYVSELPKHELLRRSVTLLPGLSNRYGIRPPHGAIQYVAGVQLIRDLPGAPPR